MTIKPWELDPLLRLHSGLNKILHLANEHIESASKRALKQRREIASSSCIYHTVLVRQLLRASELKLFRGKPDFTSSYLKNIEIEYLPDRSVWKILITNGGTKRKNARLQYKIKETLYLRKLQGNYIIDEEFQEVQKVLE